MVFIGAEEKEPRRIPAPTNPAARQNPRKASEKHEKMVGWFDGGGLVRRERMGGGYGNFAVVCDTHGQHDKVDGT